MRDRQVKSILNSPLEKMIKIKEKQKIKHRMHKAVITIQKYWREKRKVRLERMYQNRKQMKLKAAIII